MTLPPGARDPQAVGGGDINEAYRVTLADGRTAFVKTRRETIAGEYAAEAAGLPWLAEPGLVRTPKVLEQDEAYLALEWIERGSLSPLEAEELGRALAGTHLAGAERFGAPAGAPADTGFGSLRLPNGAAPDWPTFYAQQRMLPLLAQARDRGAVSARGMAAVERVCSRLAELAGPREPPARLHGDLWSGNVCWSGGREGGPVRAWLIDPAAHGGHPETDLAMLALFGCPHLDAVLDGYQEVTSLAPGWRERVGLHQLFPLLVHVVLFGRGYAAQAVAAARSALQLASGLP